MALSITWYLTEATRSGGSGAWTIQGSSTKVDAWFGTQAEWNDLTAAEQSVYELHIIDLTSGNTNPDLVNADELRTAMLSYSSSYTIPNNAGYLGTANLDLDNDPQTDPEPSVGLAIDGTSITSSNHAIIITLEPITATTVSPVPSYQGGQGHFDPFRPGKLTPPCFARGTMIRTPDGDRAVETLTRGDLIDTADHGPRRVALVMSVVVSAAELACQPALRPIRIRAGALGPGQPSQDLLVSPQHRMLVRSKIALRMFGVQEILVAAKQLLSIDGVEIDDTVQQVEYFHILFDRHEVIFANDAQAESLYAGSEGLKGVGRAARAEIFTLFPELRTSHEVPVPARMLVPGRQGRQLALRHAGHSQQLVM